MIVNRGKLHILNRIILALVIAMALALTGCAKKTELIESALLKAQEQGYEEALSILDEAETAGEDPKLIARARGIAYIGLAKYDEAKDCLLEALSYSGGHVREAEIDESYYLAVAQYKSGHIDDAIDTYTAILGMRPKDANTFYMRGTLRLEKELLDDAIRDFNCAVDNDKKNPDMYIRIYEALAGAGYEEQGSDYLDQTEDIDVKFTDFQKGKIYFCKGDYENARTFLEKARKNDNAEGVILYLGRTYEALGDSNYAASLYKTYIEKNSDDAEVLNQLGLCQMATGDYDGALESFEKGLSVEGAAISQSLKFNQIVAYEYRGDFDQAALLMKSYIAAYPDDAAAQREYLFLKTR